MSYISFFFKFWSDKFRRKFHLQCIYLMSERQLFILHSLNFIIFLYSFWKLGACLSSFYVFVLSIHICFFFFMFAQRNYYILNFLIIYWIHKFTSQISLLDTTQIPCIPSVASWFDLLLNSLTQFIYNERKKKSVHRFYGVFKYKANRRTNIYWIILNFMTTFAQ